MKKYLLAAVFSVFSVYPSDLMEDRPALSRAERAVRWGVRAGGAYAGLYPGGITGAIISEFGSDYLPGPADVDAYDPREVASISAILAGSVAGMGVGYRAGNAISNRALARWHGVSYKIEKISQFYNLNLGQYGALLSAAKIKYIKNLSKQIDAVFTRRFGSNWQVRLSALFNEYQDVLPKLLKKRVSDLSQNERDSIRMVEIGAAMANIYFDTKPMKKTMLKNAIKLYQEVEITA